MKSFKGTGQTVSHHRILNYLRKNIFNILFWFGLIFILISSDAKTWVIRQLGHTGIFNAGLDKEEKAAENMAQYDFDFSDEDGILQNTSELRGKVLFINFWASWCPPCRAEFPSIEKLYLQFETDTNICFIMINEDREEQKGIEYLTKESLSVPFHRLQSHIPNEIYNGALPTTLVIDKKGNIRMRHTGFSNYASGKFISQIQNLVKE